MSPRRGGGRAPFFVLGAGAPWGEKPPGVGKARRRALPRRGCFIGSGVSRARAGGENRRQKESAFFLQIVDFLIKFFSPSLHHLGLSLKLSRGQGASPRRAALPRRRRRDACAAGRGRIPRPDMIMPNLFKNTASPPPPGRPRRGAADKRPSAPPDRDFPPGSGAVLNRWLLSHCCGKLQFVTKELQKLTIS